MSFNEEKDVSDQHDLDRRASSEDLEDCPLNNEHNQFPIRKRRWRYWPKNESPFWRFYSIFMTAISIILLATAIHSSSDECHKDDVSSTHSHTEDVISTHPKAEDPLKGYPKPHDSWKKDNLVETRFFRDLRYMSLDPEMDYLWKEHLFMATGNIQLPDGNGNTSLKGIAMFHQMHCLAKMRMVMQLAKTGVDIGTDWRDDAHWPHCFDYLRESIMCYADSTLESVSLQPGPIDNGKFVKVIDGGSEVRYCRDTRPLYELERKYGPNSQYGFGNNEKFEVAPGK